MGDVPDRLLPGVGYRRGKFYGILGEVAQMEECGCVIAVELRVRFSPSPTNYKEVTNLKIFFKKYGRLLKYMARWQLSSLVLYPCIALLPFHPFLVAFIANFIGSLIFFKVDDWIFNKSKVKD